MEEQESTKMQETPKKEMRGIIGIANLGNTCYMNSAIQALRHCPEWTIYCKQDGKLHENIRDKESKPGKITIAYQDLIQSIWGGTGPAFVKPMGFYDNLRQVVEGTIYEDFVRRTPQDAHEFLTWILDQMYMATQREVKIVIQNPSGIAPLPLKALEGWKNAFEKHYSPLTDLIFGMLHIQYKCGGCNTVHSRFETFNTLKVKPLNGKTLNETIEAEFSEEAIEGYDCDACKQKTTTKKTASIWRLPRVLIVTLKRFTPFGMRDNSLLNYDGSNVQFTDMFSKESNEESKNKTYQLFATIEHHGNHQGGHYTSQCFNPVWKRWSLYDDDNVYDVEKPKIGTSTYIMLFRYTD